MPMTLQAFINLIPYHAPLIVSMAVSMACIATWGRKRPLFVLVFVVLVVMPAAAAYHSVIFESVGKLEFEALLLSYLAIAASALPSVSVAFLARRARFPVQAAFLVPAVAVGCFVFLPSILVLACLLGYECI